ncbi:hypothetical protein GF356_06925 [candidate division GN15 bacterium]|nr:hypothetical protein [candidate division GN15 bacterium]
MRVTHVIATLALVLVLVGTASGQFQQHPNDFGAADTIDMVFSVVPDYTTNQLHVQMDMWVFNDSNEVIGSSTGFVWENDNLSMDSAHSYPVVTDYWGIGPFFYEDSDIGITNANDRFLFGGSILFPPGIPTGPDRRLWASYYFTLDDWNASDSIVLDTLAYSEGTFYTFVGAGQLGYTPYWTGRQVIYDSAYTPPSNLILTPDSLHFDGIAGGATPASQSFEVTSSNDSLAFNIVEDANWILLSPVTGTTPREITVSLNTFGLSAGTYIDTLEVTSADASNSPQYVVVSLTLEEPPPEIGVSDNVFFFNAIVNGADPSPKTLTITNGGGGTLNWTASNSEMWLTVSPGSGVDSGDVELSVDVTGLTFGEYYDTVVVSDPAATNDPVAIPVTLNMASDLPIIEVDSPVVYSVIPDYVSPIDPIELGIRNGGQGAMNWWIEGGGPRILSVFPDSGAAPDTAFIEIDDEYASSFAQFTDTLWVYSNEAVNSPVQVLVKTRYVEFPAMLWVNKDTISFDVYECGQGGIFGGNLPEEDLIINNAGQDNPLYYYVGYESDLFEVTLDSGETNDVGTVKALVDDLPLGTYYDTIWVSAPKAFNSPQMVVVEYNMLAATQPPEILLQRDSIVITSQENSGPVLKGLLPIYNAHPGCMAWEIDESIGWFYPDTLQGNLPGSVELIVNTVGYPFGQYVETFDVTAAGATNTPYDVTLHLKVWRFRGDVNYDAAVNIQDLAYYVQYLFNFGPAPQPERLVGDVNCDRRINIEDMTYFVNYLFNGGPIPCGNPFKK